LKVRYGKLLSTLREFCFQIHLAPLQAADDGVQVPAEGH
jgi:hypothetical protein